MPPDNEEPIEHTKAAPLSPIAAALAAQLLGPPREERVTLHKQIQPHSVELSLTAAGKVSASVKVYDDDPHQAFLRAAAVFDAVRAKYPEGKP